MPNQVVIIEDSRTSKLRVVYNGSSKLKRPSFNECLEASESRYAEQFRTFIRFRLHNIAVVADIEKSLLKI